MAREDGFGKVDRRTIRVDRPTLNDLLPVEAGGNNYDFKYERRCRVCSAGTGVLELVNSLLASGSTYRDVLRALDVFNETKEKSRKISYSSIRNHQKRHMPFEAQAIRDIVERRAEKEQKDFVDGYGTIITPASYAEVMMQKGFESLVSGGAIITPREGLQAARTLHSFTRGETEGQIDAATAIAQLNRIINAVKRVATGEQIEKIVALLEEESFVDAIEEEDRVVDAEEFDEDDIEEFDPGLDEDDEDEDDYFNDEE